MTSPAFLTYFHKELTYLRQAGTLFAQKHPKIAQKLNMAHGESSDPHVARLIESFAFLSAQLHQTFDDRFPQIASGLLSVLYPQFMAPLPAVAVAHFDIKEASGAVRDGYPIPKGSELFAYGEDNFTAKFQTAFPVMLWPMRVLHVDFDHLTTYTMSGAIPRTATYIKMTFKTLHRTFRDLLVNDVMLYLGGDRLTRIQLYRAMMSIADDYPVLYALPDKSLKALPSRALQTMGFEKDEQLFPATAHAHPSYQLLQEYFHFPEKHLFLKLNHLLEASRTADTDTLEIFIPIQEEKDLARVTLSPSHFLLGCTPIVNLFEKTTDPIRFDHKKLEYRLSPDARLEKNHEIHSILQVNGVKKDGTLTSYAPYYSFQHRSKTDLLWQYRRTPSTHLMGTDVYLNFVNKHINAHDVLEETIYAKTLCTNRMLTDSIQAGDALHFEGNLPTAHITCLTKPVKPSHPSFDGESLWKMVSQLAINHLGYSSPDIGLSVLKESLFLYASTTQNHVGTQIEAITHFSSHESVRRIPRVTNDQAWCGFLKGIGIDITINEDIDPSGMSFILAQVLRHFFAMNVRIDSFAEMTVSSEQREEAWAVWKALNGYHHLF